MRASTALGIASIVLAALVGTAASDPRPASSTPAPSEDGSSTVMAVPPTTSPGATVTIIGRCWIETTGAPHATDHVRVSARLVPTPGAMPFVLSLRADPQVDPDDGTYRGRLELPGDAPVGTYVLSAMCGSQDWVVSGGSSTFVVKEVEPNPEAPPATPQPAVIAFTG